MPEKNGMNERYFGTGFSESGQQHRFRKEPELESDDWDRSRAQMFSSGRRRLTPLSAGKQGAAQV